WAVLTLVTIGAASLLALRAHPGHLATTRSPISNGLFPASLQLNSQAPSRATHARLEQAYGKLPLTFIANHGQLDRRVAYYVPGRDKSLYFTAGGVTFALTGQRPPRSANASRRPVVVPASYSVGDRSDPTDLTDTKSE